MPRTPAAKAWPGHKRSPCWRAARLASLLGPAQHSHAQLMIAPQPGRPPWASRASGSGAAPAQAPSPMTVWLFCGLPVASLLVSPVIHSSGGYSSLPSIRSNEPVCGARDVPGAVSRARLDALVQNLLLLIPASCQAPSPGPSTWIPALRAHKAEVSRSVEDPVMPLDLNAASWLPWMGLFFPLRMPLRKSP